jgi:hypothetical protein
MVIDDFVAQQLAEESRKHEHGLTVSISSEARVIVMLNFEIRFANRDAKRGAGTIERPNDGNLG